MLFVHRKGGRPDEVSTPQDFLEQSCDRENRLRGLKDRQRLSKEFLNLSWNPGQSNVSQSSVS